jgi:hypothetical protein
MKELDATIGGLYEQTAHGQKALADLKSGHHNIETRTNETFSWPHDYGGSTEIKDRERAFLLDGCSYSQGNW